MPYSSQWVDPELFLSHRGIKVYHTYKDDDMEQGSRTYWFTLDPLEGEGTGGEALFDVRDLPGFVDAASYFEMLETAKQVIRTAIDAGYFDALDLGEFEGRHPKDRLPEGQDDAEHQDKETTVVLDCGMYLVRMSSDVFGTEHFEYDSMEEAKAGFERLKASILAQEDGVTRTLELIVASEEVGGGDEGDEGD